MAYTALNKPTSTAAFVQGGYDFEKTGYNIWVVFSDPTNKITVFPRFACRSVKDAGFEAGDPIDITTNATVGAREQAPADLSTPTEITLTAAYNLQDRALALDILNVPLNVTIEYRSCGNRAKSRSVTYEGAFLSGFDPQEMSEGNMPEVSVTIGFPGGTHYGEAGDSYNPAGTLKEDAGE